MYNIIEGTVTNFLGEKGEKFYNKPSKKYSYRYELMIENQEGEFIIYSGLDTAFVKPGDKLKGRVAIGAIEPENQYCRITIDYRGRDNSISLANCSFINCSCEINEK
ncbi:hypothetical protein [Xanthocytophaga flava]|uniref:hypothetical protein n=1 Tax=Xanthocytophaga flava TaxID=3048013 RepID=UPI0028D6DA09|nr:hypothetical protein [Xanthocytophaga flavus]MDJ1471006.1 hypothetical protein [Xanthocytophaga flavus]